MNVSPDMFLLLVPYALTIAIWVAGYFTVYDEPFSLYSDHWFVALIAIVCSVAIWTLYGWATEALSVARVAGAASVG